MSKICIFNVKKICSNCGECEVCELNSNKKCNNCGKCLELEGYDIKAIKIDEVFEHEEIEDIEDIAQLENNFSNKNEIHLAEEEDIIDQLPMLEEDASSLAEEEFLKLNLNLNKEDFIPENDEVWEYIDDIDGMKELLENEEGNSELLQEEFPGLIRLKRI